MPKLSQEHNPETAQWQVLKNEEDTRSKGDTEITFSFLLWNVIMPQKRNDALTHVVTWRNLKTCWV